jgi:hypothetical protein
MCGSIQTTTSRLIVLTALMSGSGARAGDLWYEFAEPYLQRIEGVTASAGNAKDVNAVSHMIDPWPHYVHNRRIPGSGERMAVVVGRYRQARLPALGATQPTYSITTVDSLKALQYELVRPTEIGPTSPAGAASWPKRE